MSNFNQAKLALLQESYQRKFERVRAVQAQYDLETRVEEKLRMRHVLTEDWQELAAIEQQIQQLKAPQVSAPSKQRWQAQGTDEYGRYVEVCVKGVCQRLRWMNQAESGFWLADTACTQAFWRAVMGHNPAEFKGDERPVERVSWYGVLDFLDKLNQQVHGLQARLPTEAEWVLGCEVIDQVQGSADATCAVKALPPNPLGLYQMLGNVWEWCADDFDQSGNLKVLRGGCWLDKQFDVSRRGRCAAGNRDYTMGFRWMVQGF